MATVDLLIVGGGAGGGVGEASAAGDGAGGGGGGGVREVSARTLAPGIYPVTVGDGGLGATAAGTAGASGADSTVDGLTATGGGYGARDEFPGGDGGSGGGGGGEYNGLNAGGAGNTPSTSPAQGSAGGSNGASDTDHRGGGGGGGADAAGQAGQAASRGGNGGAGRESSIDGTARRYGSGGGGGSGANNATGSTGGTNAGNGGAVNTAGASAPANFGGGGGGAGAGASAAGNGGKGRVVIRYTTGSIVATGGTITTSGGYTIHTFTASGTFTILVVDTDALTLTLGEADAVAITRPKADSETLSLALTDADTVAITRPKTDSETLSLTLTDADSVLITTALADTDTLGLALTEADTVAVDVGPADTDTLALTLTETDAITIPPAGRIYLSVAGVERGYGRLDDAAFADQGTLSISDLSNEAPNTTRFSAQGFTTRPGDALLMYRSTQLPEAKIFGGRAITVVQSYVGTPAATTYHVAGIDPTWAFSRRLVWARYTAESASAIAIALVTGFSTGFSTAGIVADLPEVDEISFTAVPLMTALRRLAARIGGYCDVTYDDVVRLFLVDTGATPTPLTPAHPSLEAFSVTRHIGGMVTRALVTGGGAVALTEITPGETILPVSEPQWYDADGGEVTSGPQRVTYAGVDVGGGGGLVGPGASPSAAPTATLANGTGVDVGDHDYGCTFETADGESVISPLATVTTGSVAAPTAAPTAGTATSGTGPDDGTHDYVLTNVTPAGETTPSPASGAVTTSSVAADPVSAPSSAPSNVVAYGNYTPGWAVGDVISYRVTYVNAYGETTASPASVGVTGTAADGGYLNANTVSLPVSGHASVTGRRLYRYKNGTIVGYTPFAAATPTSYVDYSNIGVPGVSPPGSNTAIVPASYTRVIPLSGLQVPTDPHVTGRKLYRRFNGTGTYKLVNTLNTSDTTYPDTIPNASLGANAPSANTAALQQVALSDIPIGQDAVTARNVYRTALGSAQPKLLTTIANNTTTTYTDATADASLGADAPTSDTSGLLQAAGQVVAGATSIPVAGMSGMPSAGWAVIGNGQQVIRYENKSGAAIAGIPATGAGSIAAAISYNSTITAAPQLKGVPASGTGAIAYVIRRGDDVNVFEQVDDLAAQAALAARVGGDGVREDHLEDRRISAREARAWGQAFLAQRGPEVVSLNYVCRDPETQAGRTISVNLPAPTSVVGDFVIQSVTIDTFSPELMPQYHAIASSERFSFEDLLRQIAGPPPGSG